MNETWEANEEAFRLLTAEDAWKAHMRMVEDERDYIQKCRHWYGRFLDDEDEAE